MSISKEQGRIPQQKRSKETREKIIRAAKMLFSKSGFQKTTSKHIAREAGVAIGSFYAYFQDKKEVLLCVINEYFHDVSENFFSENGKEEMIKADKKLFIKKLVHTLYNGHFFHPDLFHEMEFLKVHDKEIRKVLKKHEDFSINNVKELLSLLKDDLITGDIDNSAKLVYIVLENVIHTVKFNPGDYDDEKMLDQLTDMLVRYLFKQ